MGRIFISCAEAARRISESQEVRLSGRARWGLWLHLAFCRFCRRYLRQVRFMRRVLPHVAEHLEEMGAETLSAERRRRIVSRLEGVE